MGFTILIKSGLRKGDFLYSSYFIIQPHYLTNEENQGSRMQKEKPQLSPFRVENVLEGLCVLLPQHLWKRMSFPSLQRWISRGTENGCPAVIFRWMGSRDWDGTQ